jgi:hypothetical protein
MVSVQYYQNAVTGATVAECEENYKALLRQNGLIIVPETKTASVTGILSEIRSAVISGNTYYYLKLEGSDTYYVISAAISETAIILSVGDQVEIMADEKEGAVRQALSVEKKD